MIRIVRKPLGLCLLILGIVLLVACSPMPDGPTSLSLDASQTQPVAEISPTKDISPTIIESTKTNVPLPAETAIEESEPPATQTPSADVADAIFADVLSVDVSGSDNAYQFSVEIRSPDTGCEQYADWWEVVTQDGELIYRRILLHSHVAEQPFTRSGGPVLISADTIVTVRAHMNPGGYGGAAFQGSVSSGFEAIQLAPDFAKDLEGVDPLPSGCDF